MDWKVDLHNQEGERLDPKCKCGNSASSCIIGENAYMYQCNTCAYGDQKSAKFIYKRPDGTIVPVTFPT